MNVCFYFGIVCHFFSMKVERLYRPVKMFSMSVLFVFVGLHSVFSQEGDCVYPIVFVHGLNSSNATWDDLIESLSSEFGEPQVLAFNLNANFSSTKYEDDVKWVSSPSSVAAGCLYTINFDVQNGTTGQSASNEAGIVKQGYALKLAIEKILQVTSKGKVVLVGHSMGGLAARDYLQRWGEAGTVAKLFTLGTPHLGANTAQNWGGLAGIDVLSEASRDLAVSVSVSGQSSSVPGYYLFGGDESLDQYRWSPPALPELFYNQDVNCNGVIDQSVEGINAGTRDNPAMPLPPDVKYTYYVSNINHVCVPATGFGCFGDGAVDDMNMWLYSGGDGSTYDYVNGLSIPEPNDGVSYRLSDRVTSASIVSHIGQTHDIDNIIRGLDEADFPYFAYVVSEEVVYKGMLQQRADFVAANSNAEIPGSSNADPMVDSDWYRVLVSATDSVSLYVVKPSGVYARIDFFKQQTPAPYFNGMPADTLYSLESTEDETGQMVLNLGVLSPGEYYFRITGAVGGSGLNVYSFKLGHSPIEEVPEVVSGSCFNLIYANYVYQCGENVLYEVTATQIFFSGRSCGTSVEEQVAVENPSGNTGGGSGSSGGGVGVPGTSSSGNLPTPVVNVPVVTENDECNACIQALLLNAQELKAEEEGGN